MPKNIDTVKSETENERNDTKDKFQRKCSIIISMVASLLLLNGLGSQNATSEAAFQNASAINTYAFFQAKNIRQNDLNLAASTLEAIAATSTAAKSDLEMVRAQAEALRAKAKSYESEPDTGEGKKELLALAKGAEQVRDLAMAKGPYFDISGLLLQLSIILFSVVLITERKTLYVSGIVTAALGTFLTADAFWLFMPIPFL
jgi:hypothetical protein